jgi:hypothetical protein
MPSPLRIHMIARDNGAGLSRDMQVLRQLLVEAGFELTVTALGHRSRLNTALRVAFARLVTRLKLDRPPRYDINLMIERIRPEWFAKARHSVLLPHPEWFPDDAKVDLPGLSLVLAKTRHAERIFGELGCATRFIGFTGADHRRPIAGTRERAFLHAPGRSGNKGSKALVALWKKHPHWPMLTLVWRKKNIVIDDLPANVTWRRDFMPDDELLNLQNTLLFQLCPSQTEGYGHYLSEALSTGAVTVTTDAEPMNELVTAERGVLVAARDVGRQGQARLYDFDEDAMAAAIERCIGMPAEEAARLSNNARAWYEQNEKDFMARFSAALRSLAPSDSIARHAQP